MVTDAQIGIALEAFDQKAGYSKIEKIRAALEAALPAAEPVSSIVPDHCSGTALIFEGGCLHVRKDGSGHIVVDEDDFKLEDDRCEGEHGSEGSVHWIARFPAGEMTALRNFLNGQDFPAPPAPSSARPQCCMCGKKGLSTVEGDGGTECELSDGRWVCSSECYDRAVEPAPSVAVKALHQAASDFMHLFIQDGHLTMQDLEDTDLIPAYEKLSAALSAQVQDVAIPGVKLGMPMLQALSRLAGSRHSDGTSSIVSASDRSVIIDACHAIMTGTHTSLFGPFAHLNGTHGLNEEFWNVDSDPGKNDNECFTIPLYSLVDPFAAAPAVKQGEVE